MLGATGPQQAFLLVLFTLSKHNCRVTCHPGSNLYKWGQRSNMIIGSGCKSCLSLKQTVLIWQLFVDEYHESKDPKLNTFSNIMPSCGSFKANCSLYYFTLNWSEFKPRVEGPDSVFLERDEDQSVLSFLSLSLSVWLIFCPLQLLEVLSNVFQPAGELWHFHLHVIDGFVALLLKQLLWIT